MFVRIRKERSERYDLQIKDAFSLRDEIGTCPNIEIDIYIIDKKHFLLDLTM